MTEFPNTFPGIQELRATHSDWINFEIKNLMAHMTLIISNKYSDSEINRKWALRKLVKKLANCNKVCRGRIVL